jgi:hypothetical protein
MSGTQERQGRVSGPRPKLNNFDMARCYQCHGHFGLVRRRFALKQFCSKACVEKYKADTEQTISRIKRWAEFLSRKR